MEGETIDFQSGIKGADWDLTRRSPHQYIFVRCNKESEKLNTACIGFHNINRLLCVDYAVGIRESLYLDRCIQLTTIIWRFNAGNTVDFLREIDHRFKSSVFPT